MKHSELLNTQLNAENEPNNSNSNSEELQTRKQLEGTPFWIVGSKDQGFQIIMGKYSLLNKPAVTEEAAEWELDKDHWNIISKMMIITYNTLEEFKKQDEQTEKKWIEKQTEIFTSQPKIKTDK